ncbi:hypothetical protein RJZ90_007175 [Blastomyces dermatitidis]
MSRLRPSSQDEVGAVLSCALKYNFSGYLGLLGQAIRAGGEMAWGEDARWINTSFISMPAAKLLHGEAPAGCSRHYTWTFLHPNLEAAISIQADFQQTPKKFKTTSHHESIQHESANHKESNLLHFNVIFTDGSDRLQDLFYATQLSSGNIPLTSTSGRCASLVSEGFENSDRFIHGIAHQRRYYVDSDHVDFYQYIS